VLLRKTTFIVHDWPCDISRSSLHVVCDVYGEMPAEE
jgi:hypothetical protein